MKRHHRRGSISGRQLDHALRRAGFTPTRCHGGHRIYCHLATGYCVVVPSACLGRDLTNGVVASINADVIRITGTELQL